MMPNPSRIRFSPLFFILLFLPLAAAPGTVLAANFDNPVLKTPAPTAAADAAAPFAATPGCTAENLRSERFLPDMNTDGRLKLCRSLEKITYKLNATRWSPALFEELKNIWRVFSAEPVALRPMPPATSSRMLAMAEPFPSGNVAKFEASVYVRADKSDKDSFFSVLLHELRHVYDFHETWKNRARLSSVELERRAFLLMGRIAQETPERESFSGLPTLWKDSWAKLPAAEIASRREEAVDKYLRETKLYRSLQESNQALDFSYLNRAPSTSASVAPVRDAVAVTNAVYKKGEERLPTRPAPPPTAGLIAQKVQELGFNLEKPRNPRDEREILRVALANEKKIYYGMSNFVYDQKLQLQCWRKGKLAGSFAENNTIARAGNGSALFQQVSAAAAPAPKGSPQTPCVTNYRDLKTDFTETFWASPALEKMPIRFAGFADVDGKILARYSVLKPDEKLYNQLASEYSAIKPFRVFVGTIYVSPEDGQIVKFWGTSFPEDSITSNDSQRVVGSYSVTALRQKLNLQGGVWVTVYIGTVAVANVGSDNSRPFSYTVNFENYRQSTTDMRILDDEETVGLGRPATTTTTTTTPPPAGKSAQGSAYR